MAVLKKASETKHFAEVLDFFTTEEVQHNLTFLMLVDSMLRKGLEDKQHLIQIIDSEDENKIFYYTNDKFLEVIDLYGLDGFIY